MMPHERMLATLVVLALGGADCTPPPSVPAPPAASSSKPGPPPVPVGPGIVGHVIVTTTKKPPVGGVVYLENAFKDPGVAMSATIEVFHKEFTPHITVITTGGMVTFQNMEALPHHVFSPDVKDWDTGFLRKNETAGRIFYDAGVIALLCNVHPEMLGYLVVVPGTQFGKLGADGQYLIDGVQPGTYKITAWAPRIPKVTQSVTVGSSGFVTSNFELTPEN